MVQKTIDLTWKIGVVKKHRPKGGRDYSPVNIANTATLNSSIRPAILSTQQTPVPVETETVISAATATATAIGINCVVSSQSPHIPWGIKTRRRADTLNCTKSLSNLFALYRSLSYSADRH